MEWRKIFPYLSNRRFVPAVMAIAILVAPVALRPAHADAATRAASTNTQDSKADLSVPLEFNTQPIRWNPDDRSDLSAGELEWAGGIEIKSDNKDFGGWSAMAVSADGTTLLALSDQAHWLSAQILYDERGRLSGLADGSIAPLIDLKGKPITSKSMGDAEGLTVIGDDPLKGEAYVSFERFHRIWRYDLGADGFAARPSQIVTERQFGEMPSNSGIEALTTLEPIIGGDKQRLLAITEDARDPKGNRKAFLVEGRKLKRLSTKLDAPYKPTDVARLPNGDFLMLERSFSLLAGPGMELRRIKASDVKEGALLDGKLLLRTNNKHTIDNMEGLAVRQGPKGQIFVYLISDDNYSILQHTYLMMFKLNAESEDAHRVKPGTLGAITRPQNPTTAE